MATNLFTGNKSEGEEAKTQLNKINRQFEEKATIERAKKLGLSYTDVANLPINIDLLYIVPEDEAKAGQLMPFFKVGKKLRLAIFDPEKPEAKATMERLKNQGYLINLSLASAGGLLEAQNLYHSEVFKETKTIENVVEDTGEVYEEQIIELAKLKDQLASLSPVEALNSIMVGGIRTGASDIHLEPYEKEARLRYRIDGVLQDIFSMPPEVFATLDTQIKHQSHMKLNLSNKPQDGRFNFIVNKRKIDVRVSTLPAVYGESVVMRLLDNEQKILDLEGLGLRRQALKDVTDALKHPNGMILCTGPTGSGKTTSLYSMLRLIDTPQNKVVTLEDPVEYNVFGITQSQIEIENDYTFAKGLRAILRHDPDIIMLGEIRDLETAQIAAQAAITGHIVLSTLHSNDAIGAIPRLVNMGLAPFMVAPALDTVIAQRLVRKVCVNCHTLDAPTTEELKALREAIDRVNTIQHDTLNVPEKIARAQGCEKCSHTGYRGQIGIYEVLRITKEIERMILEGKSTVDIYATARANQMLMLREDGMLKVIDGITTIEEVFRVTADIE